MSQILISKIKIRRGTNAQRLLVRLDQGEIAFTTDTQRLYVGNGVTLGGIPTTNKINTPLSIVNNLSSTFAEVGDIVPVNNIWYQLTATPHTNINNWGRIATRVATDIVYDQNSSLTIGMSSVSASKINPNTVSNGLVIRNNQLQVNYNTNYFGLSSRLFTPNANSLTEREILSSSFGDGLSGGNSNKITLRVNPNQFLFNTGVLNLNYGAINRIYLPQISTGSLILLSNPNIGDISSASGIFYQLTATPHTNINNCAEIRDRRAIQGSIFSSLTGLSAVGFGANSLSAIFGGTPAHTLSGAIPNLRITQFEAVSSNGISTTRIRLSSAGFLTFEGNTTTKTGERVGRFAIPIFAY
jgi:hypothetical protein